MTFRILYIIEFLIFRTHYGFIVTSINNSFCVVLLILIRRDVVEDLKAFKAGRFRPNDKSPQMSPADSKPNNISPSYDGSQVSSGTL